MPSHHCSVCDSHTNTKSIAKWEIGRNEIWVLRHHPFPSPLAGWLILDSIRHIQSSIEFNDIEASSWGLIVSKASKLVKQLTQCERVYLIAFGEGARHLHLHLIPRCDRDENTKAWEIADLYRKTMHQTSNAANENTINEIIKKGRILWE